MDHLLTGLAGENPLGFLAALGVLRVLHEHARKTTRPEPTLRWEQRDAWRPIVAFDGTFEGLCEVLDADRNELQGSAVLGFSYPVTKLDSKGVPKTVFARDLKSTPAEMHSLFDHVAGLAARGHELRDATLLPALASETAVAAAGSPRRIKPSPLHFCAGQQEFLAACEELRRDTTGADLDASLRGLAARPNKLPTLRWEAGAERVYALRSSNPATDRQGSDPGAEWLAFRGLSFMRCFDVRGALPCLGWRGPWKGGHWVWPLWDGKATARTVQSVLGHPLLETLEAHARNARGILVVYSADVTRSDQGGYGNFSPPSVR